MDNRQVFNVDLREFRPPRIPGRTLFGILAVLGALIVLWSTFYQVQPEEVGVVLRFGKYVRTTEPGLRGKIPFAEEVIKVPVQRQLKHEFGFRTVRSDVRSQFATTAYQQESLMLTGDLNVAIVEWIVQYRVADPYYYLFKVRNVEETFRDMNEAVLREVVGDRTVTEVLTVGRQEIEIRAQELLQDLCTQYETGITIDQVVLQDVNPPDPVKPSWDEVNQSQQQRDRLINEARAEYNEVIPRARGEAEQLILQADGYAMNRVNRANGDAARFKSVYEAYRRAPDVTRKRLYLETMQRVIPKLGTKLLLDDKASNVLPLLQMEAFQRQSRQGGGSQ